MKPVRTSAKAVIVSDGRVLVVKKIDATGPWYLLPGGGQNPGEPLHDALRRECIEEIGATVKIGDLIHVRDYVGANHEFADEDPDFHQVEFMFECSLPPDYEPTVGTVPDKDQTATEWLDLSTLERARLYPKALIPILKALPARTAPTYLGDVN
jgi:8-oxo-dGTP pyrophosphatase MutT (NUDIX family)